MSGRLYRDRLVCNLSTWLRLFCTRRLRFDYGVYLELSGTSFVRSFVRCEIFSSPRIFFSSPRKFFRPRENLGKKSLDRRDQFCPKIVEIGGILAIFEAFENWKFTSHFWVNSADRPGIHCIIPPHSGTNLGTIGRIRQKVAYEVLNFRYI